MLKIPVLDVINLRWFFVADRRKYLHEEKGKKLSLTPVQFPVCCVFVSTLLLVLNFASTLFVSCLKYYVILYPCSICTKTTDCKKESIHCDGCDLWVHGAMIPLESDEITRYGQNEEIFVCRPCLVIDQQLCYPTQAVRCRIQTWCGIAFIGKLYLRPLLQSNRFAVSGRNTLSHSLRLQHDTK